MKEIDDDEIIRAFLVSAVILICIAIGYILDKNKTFSPYPERKPHVIISRDDCYAGDNFTHEILSAKETEKRLMQLMEKK